MLYLTLVNRRYEMMNRKFIGLVALGALILPVLIGCASIMPRGGIYTNIQLPVGATGVDGAALKVGTAECKSILGLVATGDCSIDAAKKNGEISEVQHMDWDANSILGLIGNYKLTVYGK
jgi:hypothetical protein